MDVKLAEEQNPLNLCMNCAIFLWIEHKTFNISEFCTCKQFTTQVVKYVFVKELAPDRAYFCQS